MTNLIVAFRNSANATEKGSKQVTKKKRKKERERKEILHSSGILRRVEWLFVTDVSGQHIGPIFKQSRKNSSYTD
jgi:hypothetical protein